MRLVAGRRRGPGVRGRGRGRERPRGHLDGGPQPGMGRCRTSAATPLRRGDAGHEPSEAGEVAIGGPDPGAARPGRSATRSRSARAGHAATLEIVGAAVAARDRRRRVRLRRARACGARPLEAIGFSGRCESDDECSRYLGFTVADGDDVAEAVAPYLSDDVSLVSPSPPAQVERLTRRRRPAAERWRRCSASSPSWPSPTPRPSRCDAAAVTSPCSGAGLVRPRAAAHRDRAGRRARARRRGRRRRARLGWAGSGAAWRARVPTASRSRS